VLRKASLGRRRSRSRSRSNSSGSGNASAGRNLSLEYIHSDELEGGLNLSDIEDEEQVQRKRGAAAKSRK